MIGILQGQRVPHEPRHPIQNIVVVEVDGLPIESAPHHGRIVEELAAMKAPMTRGREVEGIGLKFIDRMGDQLFISIGNLQHPPL